MMRNAAVKYMRLKVENGDQILTPVYVLDGPEVSEKQLENVLTVAREMLRQRGLALADWEWLSDAEGRRVEMETVWQWHRVEEAWEHGHLSPQTNWWAYN